MSDSNTEYFEYFVSYYQELAQDFAESVYQILTKDLKSKVYVNHIYQKKNQGRFRLNIDKIITNCKVFILLNTVGALDRKEIIREVKVAFPNGSINNRELWIFREKEIDVPRGTSEFKKETAIDLEEWNQPDFSNNTELKRIIFRLCKEKEKKQTNFVINKSHNPTPKDPFFIKISNTLYSKYIPRFPSEPDLFELKRKAKDYSDKKDYVNALKVLNQILDISPSEITTVAEKGMILAMLKRFEESEDQFTCAIYLKNNEPKYWANKGVAQYFQNKFEDSLYCIRKSISLSKKDKILFYNEATILFKIKRYEECIVAFDNALYVDPNFSLAMSGKAAVLNIQGNKKESRRLLRNAIKIDSLNYNAWYNLGVTYEEEKRYDQALFHYNKSIEINPDFYYSFINKSRILRQQGNIDEALDSYDKAIEKNPDLAELYFIKGTYLGILHRFVESLIYFDKALKIEPNSIPSRINKAESLYNLKRYEESLAIAKDVLKEDGSNVFALKIIAWIYYEESKLDMAEKGFLKVFELDPSIDIANAMIDIFRRKEKNDEKALEFCNSALKIYSNNINLLLFRSHLYIRLKRYKEAISDCDHIIQLDERQATAYYNKACAKSLLFDTNEAIQLIKIAINLDEKFRDVAKEDDDLIAIRDNIEI